jgi:hypothetical protein
MTDADGVETADEDLAVTYTCTIVASRLIDGYSASSVTYTASDITTASISIQAASSFTQSTPPFSGSYKLSYTLNGVSLSTDEISYSANAHTIQEAIYSSAPSFRYKVFVSLQDSWYWDNDYKQITLTFSGYDADAPQFSVASGVDSPLNNEDIHFFTEETTLAYDSTLVTYTPVPFEMIRTQHSSPQIVMTVDGRPIACRNVDCDYEYTVADAEITSFSLSGSGSAGDTLTIGGTDFPTSIKHVYFGQSKCSGETVSTTEIECTLEESVAAGEWLPEVTGFYGLIPVDANLANEDVAIVITSVSPNADLNLNGGTLLTIAGNYFPYGLSALPDDFAITFSLARRLLA